MVMAENKGKKFEQVVKESFLKVPNVSVDRIPDQTMKFKGATNVCDFIVYKRPHQYYIECKTVHGNTLPFTNIKSNQWDGLLVKSKIEGVYAGVLCWWVDHDVTKFIPIQVLDHLKHLGSKSIRYDANLPSVIEVQGRKKRVFFEYKMNMFFRHLERGGREDA